MIEAPVGVDNEYGLELGLALHGEPAKYSGHACSIEEPRRIPAAASVAVLAGMAVRTCEGVRSAAKAVQRVELEADAAKELEFEKLSVNDVVVLGVFVLACATGFDASGCMVLDQPASRYLPLCTLRKPDYLQLLVVRVAHHLDANNDPMRLR